MVMPMDILYIHHHDDDNENDGHYFCYTCEHGFMWHKDSDEERAHKLTKDEYEWLIDKFCKNEQWYSMLKLIHDESLDSDNEHATNKIFGMVYDVFQYANVALDFVTYTMHKHSFFITVDDSLHIAFKTNIKHLGTWEGISFYCHNKSKNILVGNHSVFSSTGVSNHKRVD